MDSVGVLVSQGRAPCRAMSNHAGRLDGWWAVQAQTLSGSHVSDKKRGDVPYPSQRRPGPGDSTAESLLSFFPTCCAVLTMLNSETCQKEEKELSGAARESQSVGIPTGRVMVPDTSS